MSELDLTRCLPELTPLADRDELVWRGPLAHLGPLTKPTPLRAQLGDLNHCGLYLVYLGCVGLLTRRLGSVMNTNLNRCLGEQIFAYQFDWRYPRPYGITLEDLEQNPDKVAAVRRTIPYFFFDLLDRTSGYFLSSSPLHEVSYVVNLTLHLAGKPNRATIERWLKGVIARLGVVAPASARGLPVLQDFPDRAGWEAAVREVHGAPLPVELLDLTSDPATLDLNALAAAQLERIDPTCNSLLAPADELRAAGFVGTPYRARDSDVARR